MKLPEYEGVHIRWVPRSFCKSTNLVLALVFSGPKPYNRHPRTWNPQKNTSSLCRQVSSTVRLNDGVRRSECAQMRKVRLRAIEHLGRHSILEY